MKSVLAAIAIACSATGAFAADAIQIATAARSIRPGEVVLFTATTSQPVAAMRARAFDRDLATFQLDANRWQSLLGIDLDTKPGTYEVSFEGVSEDARSRRRRSSRLHRVCSGDGSWPSMTHS